MFPRAFRLLLFSAFSVALCGCHSLPPISGYSRHDFEIRGQITENEIRRLDEALDALPEAMVDSIDKVSVQHPNHFLPNLWAVAHVSVYSGAGICFTPAYINGSGVIWHEVAHCYENHLTAVGGAFSGRWAETAGDVYDGGAEHRRDGTTMKWLFPDPPKLGVLTTYARNNVSEDVAEFNQQIYQFLSGTNSRITALKESGLFLTDPRYGQKLSLLHEYGFINGENYRKVLDFLK